MGINLILLTNKLTIQACHALSFLKKIIVYYCVLLCIALYSFVLLFIVSGKLGAYESPVAAGGSTNDMAALSCPIKGT